MTVVCYPTTGKRKAYKLCSAFAAGAPGGQVAPLSYPRLFPGAAFFYGWTQHTAALIAKCKRRGVDWYYADNAYYFGRGPYFRVTRNGLMHDGHGTANPKRMAQLGIEPAPYRKDGRHIVIATQSELFFRLHLNTTRQAWTQQVCAEIARHTDRPVVVCHKPDPSSAEWPHDNFEQVLPDAWAVVSHSSSVMVKALADGIPVFSLGDSMASNMGLDDLSRIEQPFYPEDRHRWLAVLMANQWLISEMRQGNCWRDLQAREARSAA